MVIQKTDKHPHVWRLMTYEPPCDLRCSDCKETIEGIEAIEEFIANLQHAVRQLGNTYKALQEDDPDLLAELPVIIDSNTLELLERI